MHPISHAAQSHLRLTVRDTDPKKIGKPFTAAVVESALATYPGMFPTTPPGEPAPYGVYWPTTVQRATRGRAGHCWTVRNCHE